MYFVIMNPHLLFVIPVVCALVIYMISFKEGKQICDNYVLVTYLYTLFYLALGAYFITILLQYYEKQLDKLSIGTLLGIIVLYVIVYYVMIFIPKEQLLLKHLISIIYIMITSVMLAVIFMMYFPQSIILSLLMTLVLFVVLTLIAWKYQDVISSRVPLIMLIVFFILVIAEFLVSLFYPGTLIEKAIILVVLLVVCYLVLVKTKRMIENRDSCEKDGGPDYVRESTGLLLTFQNMLIRILELTGRRRRRYSLS